MNGALEKVVSFFSFFGVFQIITTPLGRYFTLRQRIIRLVLLADFGLLPNCSFLNNWRDCETGFSFEIDNEGRTTVLRLHVSETVK